jgi:HAD superfamily hydrolase (TIGR01509 family)
MAGSSPRSEPGLAAVVFDMDGVLVDSESVWGEIRERFTEEKGGSWRDDAQREMMGMSSTEWSRYMRDELEVPMDADQISAEVADRVADHYREELPVLPGAVEAVRALADGWPLAVASSANKRLIDLVLELAGLTEAFAATVSSEEVERGKPEPDVYLEAAERLGVDPGDCVGVEDSASGIRAADAAGMLVVAIPNRDFPPDRESLELAAETLDSLDELTPELLESLSAAPN